jgi:hypothetical protein
MPTVTINFLQFPSGLPVPGLPSLSIPFTPSPGHGNATADKSVPGVVPNTSWTFEFWDVNGALVTSLTAPLPQPDADYMASAWYVFGGPGGHPVPHVVTSVFALDQHKVLAGKTPIASVSVAGAWSGPPSNTVATDKGNGAPVTIGAADPLSGAGKFVSWLSPGATVAQNPLTALTAPFDSDIEVAIAFYTDPCTKIEKEIDAVNEQIDEDRELLQDPDVLPKRKEHIRNVELPALERQLTNLTAQLKKCRG